MSSFELQAGFGSARVALLVVAALSLLGVIPASAAAAPGAAFVSDYSAGSVDQYTIGTGGTLSANGSVAGPGSGARSWLEAVTPDGKYLYMANPAVGSISQYSIGSAGTLSPLSPAAVAVASGEPYQPAVSPDGKNLYVASTGGGLYVYDIASDGALTLAQTETTDVTEASSVAVSPDGSSVYVGDGSNGIVQFDRASDGTLTPKPIATIAGPNGSYGQGIGITPNGKYLYASGYYSSSVYEYSIGSGGELTALSPGTASSSNYTYGMIVSPGGNDVYVSSCNAKSVVQYSVGSDGQLTQAATLSGTCGLPWMNALGTVLYVPDYDQDVSEYDVSSTGALTPLAGSPVVNSAATATWGMIIPPDQAPSAAFTDKPGGPGKQTSFDGSASSAPDGTVARYDWNFGDGTTLSNGGAKPAHTYAKAGTYKVTLTVTDDSGCSTNHVFTGQTAYCNGGPAATVTHTVVVAAAVSKRLSLSVSPSHAVAGRTVCFRFKASSGGKGVSGVKVRLAGRSASTRAGGSARICARLLKGTYRPTATKPGYTSARTTVTVTAKPKPKPKPKPKAKKKHHRRRHHSKHRSTPIFTG